MVNNLLDVRSFVYSYIKNFKLSDIDTIIRSVIDKTSYFLS